MTIFGTIAIDIDKGIFQLLPLLLLLIRASSNYWHFNRNYCFRVLPLIWPFLVSKYTLWSLMHSRLNKNACFIQILLGGHISAADTALLLLNYYCYWPFLALLLLVLVLLRGRVFHFSWKWSKSISTKIWLRIQLAKQSTNID